MSDRANQAAFKSKVIALIDALKLADTEVVGLALTLAVSFGMPLSRSQIHAMLDTALDQAGSHDEASA